MPATARAAAGVCSSTDRSWRTTEDRATERDRRARPPGDGDRPDEEDCGPVDDAATTMKMIMVNVTVVVEILYFRDNIIIVNNENGYDLK